MNQQLSHEDLIQRINELEEETSFLKRVQKDLQKSEESLNNILAASPIGIGIVENRMITRANEALLKVFRFDPKDPWQNQNTLIIYPSEQEYEEVGKKIYACLTEDNIAQLDTIFKRKDGTTFLGHLKVKCDDPLNPMKKAIITVSDISWRKEMEQERVEKEKLQSMMEIAGAICHELNQPLQAVVFEYSELMCDYPEPHDIHNKLVSIKNNVDRMGTILKKLMSITSYKTTPYINGTKIVDIHQSEITD